MAVLKRIGIFSFAKIAALAGAIVGLVAGIVFALIAGIAGSITGMPFWFRSLGMLAIVIFPIAYGIVGFIWGAVIAAIYNAASHFAGGVILELE